MKLSVYPFLIAAIASPALAGEITFGPVRSEVGQKVRMVSRVEGVAGTVTKTSNGKKLAGSIDFQRNREVTWIFRAPAADGARRGMARVLGMSREATVRLAGKEEKTVEQSPLNGKQIAFSKPAGGEWAFELDGSLKTLRIDRELKELTHYLRRSWYPDKPVKIGDTWEFDPVWIKSIVEKELHSAQTIATMQLRQVRHTVDGGVALLTVRIESTGGDFRSDGTETSASIDLKGELAVDLATMLDRQLNLTGTLHTRSGTLGETTVTEVPITVDVQKSFTRD